MPPTPRPFPPSRGEPRRAPLHSIDDPNAVHGRMTPITHQGALPWIQLRNAMFHPSIYRKMIGRIDPRAKNGDLVYVYDRDGHPFGLGLFSDHGMIGLRMLTFDVGVRGSEGAPDDESIIASRLAQAVRLRKDTLALDKVTDAYRVVHAEGDGLPGLIIDRFADYAVVELFSYPMHRRMESLTEELKMLLNVKEVLFRADERVQAAEGFTMDADAPVGPKRGRSPDRKSTQITENGLRFQIDLTHGHKTGFFCDQRDNRMALTQFTPGMDVLDLCAYSGGFGIYAATLGKAAAVTCVDIDEDAIALAQRNANLNKVPRSLLTTVQGDVFPYLRQIQPKTRGAAGGKTFDVVVLDPPKLIANSDEKEEGRMKYFDLNRLAMTVVKPGGTLVTCSCSGLFTPEDFFNVLKGAARGARRRVQVLRQTGPGADHPVMTDCPESSYLKCLWAKIW